MSSTAFLVVIEDLGRMLVTRDEVVLAPEANVNLDDMDYLVYGWAPRFVRALRAEFSVHASAVQCPGGSLGVMGPAGAGKSTTLLGLVRRGHPLVIDDVLPVDFVNGNALVHGWTRPIHLRPTAADHFEVDRTSLIQTALETKVQVRLPNLTDRLPLRFLVELVAEPGIDAVTLQRLRGVEALRACQRNTNASGMASADGRHVAFFAWLTSLANSVPIYRLTRPESDWTLEAVLDRLEELMLSTAANPVTMDIAPFE